MSINIFTPHCIFCLNPHCLNTSKSSGSILLTIPHSVRMPGPAGKQWRILSCFCFLNKPSSSSAVNAACAHLSEEHTRNTSSLVAPHSAPAAWSWGCSLGTPVPAPICWLFSTQAKEEGEVIRRSPLARLGYGQALPAMRHSFPLSTLLFIHATPSLSAFYHLQASLPSGTSHFLRLKNPTCINYRCLYRCLPPFSFSHISVLSNLPYHSSG